MITPAERNALQKFTENTKLTPERLIERHENALKGKLVKLTEATPGIRKLADTFSGNDPETIEDLINEIHIRTAPVAVTEGEKNIIKYLYLTRTAEEILNSGRFLYHAKDVGMPQERFIAGCQDRSILAIALLKAKGFRPGENLFYVRNKVKDHSHVEVKLDNGRWYKINLPDEPFVEIKKPAKERKSRILLVAEGPHEAGIKTLSDCFKH